ncbi:hypothetical protein TNCV_501431 [Trichonephila clavipes]|nr:hypothetical protein TNCV_501431 [Trichonephila clavipes]
MPASDPAAYERDALGSLPGKPEFRLWVQAGSYELESSLLRRTVGFQAVLKEAIRVCDALRCPGPHVRYSRAHVQTGSTDCRLLTE